MTKENEELLRSQAIGKAAEVHKTREQAEEELRQQAEWLRVTIASIGDAVISTDAQGQVTLMNGVAENLTGWTLAEAAGRPLPDIFHIVNERTRLQAENPVFKALSEGTIVGLANHTILISRDGTERPIDDSAAPMLDKTGQAIGAVLVFRDVTERSQTEKALAQLAAIVDSSQDAIISKSLDGTIRSWNAAAERLFGYTAEEAIGKSITMIIPADRYEEEPQIISKLQRGEKVDHFETVRISKSGQEVHLSLTISPLRDSEGEIIGASKIARDITAQKQAEQERRRLQQEVELERARLAEAFQFAPSFMAVLRGPEHVFELANDRYFQLIGQREILGRPVREALPEVAEQGFIELLDSVYQSGQAYVGTDIRVLLQQQPDLPPQELFVEFVYQPLREATGAVSGILVQGIDLTERKRDQEQLIRVTAESERQHRLFETILSSTPDFVYVFSLDHRVIYANQSLLTLWEQTAETVVGKTFLELGYEAWHAEMHCREIDEVRTTRLPIRGEVPFDGAYGHRIYDYIFVPVFGENGEVEAVAGTTRDVTERRQMEDLLRETDRNKDQFIALLAHELRNPLAPLVNGLQVMKLSEGDQDIIAEVRVIMERQLEHMVRLIDDLLDISRLSQNKMELRKTKVLLSDVVKSAVETVRSVVENAKHELTIRLPPEPVFLEADLTRLAQVFSNLLTNSAKYTEKGGKIWFSVDLQDSEIVVTVKDTGIGIPEESLASVFDMFCQVDRSIERSSGGLGIGLALVKGLVEKHAGTVSVASEGEGKGSTFTVRLPALTPTTEAQSGAQNSPQQSTGTAKRRILVVDDNQDSANSMSMMLKYLGNEVATVYDGLAAVEAATQFQPHVILMDMGMPKLNGYEATRRIRELPIGRSVIIIALTGWGQEADRALSKAAGCNGHLVKPVNLSELQTLLQEFESPSSN